MNAFFFGALPDQVWFLIATLPFYEALRDPLAGSEKIVSYLLTAQEFGALRANLRRWFHPMKYCDQLRPSNVLYKIYLKIDFLNFFFYLFIFYILH
jgi:hypothetical protein